MQAFKDFIRMVLREGELDEDAMQPESIPEGYYVRITHRGDAVNFSFIDPDKPVPVGEVRITKPDPDEHGPCGGAWLIASTRAKKGWGPLLYDVAIEWATMNGGGLVPDRYRVSPEAEAVWNYYLHRRGDVKHRQLDDMEGTLGLPEKDRCIMASLFPGVRYTGDDWKGEMLKSPLSKLYTKVPATLQKLKQLKKLRVDG